MQSITGIMVSLALTEARHKRACTHNMYHKAKLCCFVLFQIKLNHLKKTIKQR